MNHYKSWSGLHKQLHGLLCEPLQGRVSYFLTRYHKVHNAYGRAAIRLDGKEIVGFTWVDGYRQERDLHKLWEGTGIWEDTDAQLNRKWAENGTYSEIDFLKAALSYLNLPVQQALASENPLIRVFAIMDRRLGKRTLQSIAGAQEYLAYPAWVQQFYRLRLDIARD